MKIQTRAQLNVYTACVHADKDHPATRQQLIAVSGLSDRVVRKEIEYLRKQGIRICSTNNTAGYWLAKTEAEYKDFRRSYASRLYEGLRTLSSMDRATEGQIEL